MGTIEIFPTAQLHNMGDVVRIVVLGGAGVGKSAISIQFVNGMFVEKYDPTIEESYRKTMDVGSTTHQLEILDTAGTDQFSAMRDMYIQKGDGFVMVYSVSSAQSIERVEELFKQISRLNEDKAYYMVLAGNKCDLPKDSQVIPPAKGKELAAKLGCHFYSTSAKNNKNVTELFEDVVRQVVNGRKNDAEKSGEKKKSFCTLL